MLRQAGPSLPRAPGDCDGRPWVFRTDWDATEDEAFSNDLVLDMVPMEDIQTKREGHCPQDPAARDRASIAQGRHRRSRGERLAVLHDPCLLFRYLRFKPFRHYQKSRHHTKHATAGIDRPTWESMANACPGARRKTAPSRTKSVLPCHVF